MNTVRGWVDRMSKRYPPRGFELSDYARWFPKTGDVFLRALKRSGALPIEVPGDGRRVGVVVMPWLSTATPWYAITLAIGLARRGREVAIIWDDTGFPERHVEQQNAAIGRVLEYVGRDIGVTRLGELDPQPGNEGDAALLDALARQNCTWQQRGDTTTPAAEAHERAVRASLAHSLPLIRSAVARLGLEYLAVCGGVYGSSGLFLRAGRESGCRVATYDADVGVASVCVDGIAAQCQDVPIAFDALWHAPADERRDAVATGRAEFRRRAERRDRSGFQAVPAAGHRAAGPGVDVGVLVPLNIEWDSAALGKHTHFADTAEWLSATVALVLAHSDLPVTVRQHPDERRESKSSRLDIPTLLRDRFGDNPRVRFVPADAPVSTYDLLESAQLVLPFVSTIAIEAAGLGKPVVVSGNSYYASLGFVWSASTPDEYLALVQRGIAGDLPLLPDQVERAWVCYYLSAVRNRVWTDFTPQPTDFWVWCRRFPHDLLADPDVSDLLEAIDTGIPISLLRHQKLSVDSAA